MRQFDDPQGLVRDDKTVSAEHRQVKAEQYMVAQISPHPGHRVWEFDLHTGQINEPKYESVTVRTDLSPHGLKTVHKKVFQRDNCLYCSALNKKNAIKKFVPMYARLVEQGYITRVVTTNPTENEAGDIQP